MTSTLDIMTTRAMWVVSAVLVVAGLALQYLADDREGVVLRILGAVMVTVPVGLAVNITARRRRSAAREDSPDSLEFQAALAARSGAFEGSLVLVALLMLALVLAPGSVPGLWALACLMAMVGTFWVLYLAALRGLRGSPAEDQQADTHRGPRG